MSRFVIPARPGQATASDSPDGFVDRFAKYLPAEIMSIYTVAIGGLVSLKNANVSAPWLLIVLLLTVIFTCATVWYFASRAPAGSVRSAHMVASPLIFVAWAYPLASPLLGIWFVGWVAIVGQATAAAISYVIQPK
jgi:hypothetical protein